MFMTMSDSTIRQYYSSQKQKLYVRVLLLLFTSSSIQMNSTENRKTITNCYLCVCFTLRTFHYVSDSIWKLSQFLTHKCIVCVQEYNKSSFYDFMKEWCYLQPTFEMDFFFLIYFLIRLFCMGICSVQQLR